MTNLDRSINCYFCNALSDERECMPADPYNNNDGGEVCPECMKKPVIKQLKLVQFALSYMVANIDHASEICFDDPALQDVEDGDALERLIYDVQGKMCKTLAKECASVKEYGYVGTVLVDGRLDCQMYHTDFDVLSRAISKKVCKLYDLDEDAGKEIIKQLFDNGEYHYADCQVYYGQQQVCEPG